MTLIIVILAIICIIIAMFSVGILGPAFLIDEGNSAGTGCFAFLVIGAIFILLAGALMRCSGA